jgi:hypothetical protein
LVCLKCLGAPQRRTTLLPSEAECFVGGTGSSTDLSGEPTKQNDVERRARARVEPVPKTGRQTIQPENTAADRNSELKIRPSDAHERLSRLLEKQLFLRAKLWVVFNRGQKPLRSWNPKTSRPSRICNSRISQEDLRKAVGRELGEDEVERRRKGSHDGRSCTDQHRPRHTTAAGSDCSPFLVSTVKEPAD